MQYKNNLSFVPQLFMYICNINSQTLFVPIEIVSHGLKWEGNNK